MTTPPTTTPLEPMDYHRKFGSDTGNGLKIFAVEIKATIRKTYEVEAEDEQGARAAASDIFSVLNEDGVDEDYDEEVLSIQKVK